MGTYATLLGIITNIRGAILDEELTVTQRHLDMSGVPMPNFMNIGSSLRRELNEEGDDADDNYSLKHILGANDLTLFNGVPYGTNTPDLIIEEESDSEESMTEEEGTKQLTLYL